MSFQPFTHLNYRPIGGLLRFCFRALILTLVLNGLPTCHGNHMARLRKDLFADDKIDPHSRPVENNSDTVNVEILFDIAHIHSLDEWTGTLTVNGWIKLSWEDLAVKWNPEEYGGLDYLLIPHNVVWKPDVTLYNSAQAVDMDHYGNSMLYVNHDGSVHWFPPVTFHTTCPIDHKLFPFDEHICSIVLGSWTYDLASVSLQLSEEHNNTEVTLLQYFSENPQWELLNVAGGTREIHYDCCDQTHRNVEYKLSLRRRSPFYKFILVVPSVMAMCLTLALFWLPPNAGEKVILGGVVIIIQVALLFFLGWCVPPGGKSIPAIVLFCGNSLVMSGLSLIIAVIIINLSRSHNYNPAPAALKSLMVGPIGKVLCVGRNTYQVASVKLLDENHVELGDQLGNHLNTLNSTNSHEKSPEYIDCILLATAIDRLCFVIYCIAFIMILVSSFSQ